MAIDSAEPDWVAHTRKVLSEHPELSRDEQAALLGIKRRTLQHRIEKSLSEFSKPIGNAIVSPVVEQKKDEPEYPTFTEPGLPAKEIRDHFKAAGERVMQRKKEENWFPIKLPTDDPYGICVFGDPHLGVKTLWQKLENDCETVKKTKGLWALNLGDTVDSWPVNGRLARLWSENPISLGVEWTLVRWFFHEAMPDKWLVWLLGNHDTFNTNGAAMFKEISRNVVPVMETEAKFVIWTPNKSHFPIIARHDFPGHSQFTTLHGIVRYLRERADVDRGVHVLGVEGHKHQWAIHEEEQADRGYLFTAIRAKGYKMPDEYTKTRNLAAQDYGESVVVTFNPRAKNLATQMMVHRDVGEGAAYLTWLRRRFSK